MSLKIVFLINPDFASTRSMDLYSKIIIKSLKKKHFTLKVLKCPRFFSRFKSSRFVSKWFGYFDKFIIYMPFLFFYQLFLPKGNIIVALDQALGPWLFAFTKHKKVVHIHDLTQIKASLGEFSAYKPGFFGRVYMTFIRRGLRCADFYICVSNATLQDATRLLNANSSNSVVLPNGLNGHFKKCSFIKARSSLRSSIFSDASKGYFLHVGSNEWYKNRIGVLYLYEAWRALYKKDIPLCYVGGDPSIDLLNDIKRSSYKKDVYIFENIKINDLALFYQGASCLLFPSIAEGFGWPIAEAMVSGCPVVTTDEPPMTEVSNNLAWYIPQMPTRTDLVKQWSESCASVLNRAVFSRSKRKNFLKKGCDYASSAYDPKLFFSRVQYIYRILSNSIL